MKKISFFIIGACNTDNTKDIANAVTRNKHKFTTAKISDLVFFYDNKKKAFSILYNGKSILQYDIFIFRSYSKNIDEARVLAEYLAYNNKIIIDSILAKTSLPGKLFEASKFAYNKLPHIQTLQALSEAEWKKNIDKLKFPIIIKPIGGSRGREVFKVEKFVDAVTFFQKNPNGYMAQEYIPIDGDIRVFVVGKKVIGAMKRFIVPGDVRSNASIGARTERVRLTKKLREIALAATRAKGLNIAGVDIISYNRKLYILEVNSSPQWQAFKRTTGLDPASYIVDFAIKKYCKQKNLKKLNLSI